MAYHLGFPNINFIVTFLPISVLCGPFESEKPIEILKNYTDETQSDDTSSYKKCKTKHVRN